MSPIESVIRFGPFEVHPRTGELWKSGVKVRLQDQPFKVLTVLLEHAGDLVTREELRSRLWPSEAYGDFDHAVNIAIAKLRTALGDSADSPQFIETLPRRGYRLLAPVEKNESESTEFGEISDTPAAQVTAGGPASGAEPFPAAPEPPADVEPSIPARRKLLWIALPLTLFAALALGIYQWRASRVPALNFENMRLTKLTQSGKATHVAIAPDGRYVVYVLAEGEKQSLRVRQVATASDVQVLPPSQTIFQGLTFSKDGNYVYFVRAERNSYYYASLFQMPVLGGPVRELVKDIDTPITFSPDNKRIAFIRGDPIKNQSHLITANMEGGDERILVTKRSPETFTVAGRYFGPSWSPDGRLIAASVTRPDHGQVRYFVVGVSPEDGKTRELYSIDKLIGRIQWMPDGAGLLMVIAEPPKGYSGQLWYLSYPDRKIRRLTNDLDNYDACCIDLTHDANTIATVRANLFSSAWIAPEGVSERGRNVGLTQTVLNASWLGSDKVVFQDMKSDLLLMDTSGKPATLLTPDQHDNYYPSGCGDGQHIVFVSSRGGHSGVWRMDADGSHVVPLASPTDGRRADCSPDGKWVVYNAPTPGGLNAPWKIDINGGTPVQLLNENCSWPMISPDGKFLACERVLTDPPRYAAFIVDLANKQEIRTIEPPPDFWKAYWSPDGHALDLSLMRDGITNVWRYPLSGAQGRQLTHFTSPLMFDFGWSRDGKQLFAALGSYDSDVILISNFRY